MRTTGLALALAVAMAAIAGGTVAVVVRDARLDHDRLVARCHGAGGAWLPRSDRGLAGTCLAHPGDPTAETLGRPAPAR